MNWSKAKTILIAALIITDIFLILTYVDFGFKDDEFNDNEALAEFLAQKNIYVSAEAIPERHKDMPVLYVQNEDDNCPEMTSALSAGDFPKVSENKDEEYIRIADSFIKAAGPKYDTAVFERIESSGAATSVIYKNVIDGVAIEKSRIVCFFKDGVLEDFECEWLGAVSFHSKKQNTISASQALLLFMAQNEEKKDIYINGIEMIYWLDEGSLDTETAISADTAFPTWKITYNDGETSYIDGYAHQ